jgi:hypothetical protein
LCLLKKNGCGFINAKRKPMMAMREASNYIVVKVHVIEGGAKQKRPRSVQRKTLKARMRQSTRSRCQAGPGAKREDTRDVCYEHNPNPNLDQSSQVAPTWVTPKAPNQP